jgi:hypothetical protein
MHSECKTKFVQRRPTLCAVLLHVCENQQHMYAWPGESLQCASVLAWQPLYGAALSCLCPCCPDCSCTYTQSQSDLVRVQPMQWHC